MVGAPRLSIHLNTRPHVELGAHKAWLSPIAILSVDPYKVRRQAQLREHTSHHERQPWSIYNHDAVPTSGHRQPTPLYAYQQYVLLIISTHMKTSSLPVCLLK